METKKQLQERLEAVCRDRDHKVHELEQQKRDFEEKIDKLNDEHQAATDKLETEIERLEKRLLRSAEDENKLKEELERTKRREHSLQSDVSSYEKAVARLVQPVSLKEIAATHPDFDCVAHASCFMLQPLDAFLPKLALPKTELRLRRNNGFVADLGIMKAYKTLIDYPGLAAVLPSGAEGPVTALFVRVQYANTYALCNPLSATQVMLRFRTQKSFLEPWKQLQSQSAYVQTRPVRDNIDKEEVIFVTPFPLVDPSLTYDPELDQEFSQEDIEAKQTEAQSQLRQACYQEYLRHYFFTT